MSIKITGMNSGLDTDSIIRELVSASSEKKKKLEKAQTKLEWKQTAWADLNKKIKSFYASTLSNMRFSTAFKKKKTTSSNETVATVVAGDSAVKGSQSLVVKSLAKSGYLTGGKLNSTQTVKGSTTLSSLTKGSSTELATDDTASFTVTVKGKETKIDLTGASTVDDVVSKLNAAGVNASFDEKNQRIFVSVANSGASNDFSFNANDVNGLKALSGLGLLTADEFSMNQTANTALADCYDSATGILKNTAEAQAYVTKKATAYAATLQASVTPDKIEGYRKAIEELNKQWEESGDKDVFENTVKKYSGRDVYDPADADAAYTAVKERRTTLLEQKEYLALKDKESALAPGEALSAEDQACLDELNTRDWASQDLDQDAIDTELVELANAASTFETRKSFEAAVEAQEQNIQTAAKNAKILNQYYEETYASQLSGISGTTLSEKLATVEAEITAKTANGDDTKDLETLRDQLSTMVSNETLYTENPVSDAEINWATEGISQRATADVTKEAAAAYEMVTNGSDFVSSTAVRVKGEDAVISLNGAEFTSDTNNFSINGLTITAKAVSKVLDTDAYGNPTSYEETTLNTQEDVDGVYDMIRNFFSEYNKLIKEIDGLYNAASAKDYEPLTSEEKDAMTDDEVEKWETKIKDALLRHDEDLGDVRNVLKEAMMTSIEINGKSYNLSMFGISTQGYFDAEDDERSMLHIDGDEKDSVSSGNTDVLKRMISSDPDVVTSFFTKLADNLYNKMQMMSQTSLNRTFGNFYDDKVLKNQYDDYKTKISKQETKLNNMEDRYYKMFSSMESQMARMNSTSSYISSMFGGGQ